MSRLCMKEISRALIEMISDESPYASKDMLCGARGAVFREIFIFHYPDFIEKVQKLVPGATKDEELLCMLIAVGQSVDEIEQLFCLPAEQVYMFRKSVLRIVQCLGKGIVFGFVRVGRVVKDTL